MTTKQTKTKRGDWLVTLPLAAGAIAYVVFVFLPGREVTAELKQQIETKQQTIDQTLGLAKAAVVIGQQAQKTRAYTSAWQQQCPASGELSSLYGKIRELAGASQATITRFDPESSETHPALCETRLLVGCEGSFAEVFEFLRAVEGLQETVWIREMRLDKLEGSEGNVNCELNLVIFASNSGNSDYVNPAE